MAFDRKSYHREYMRQYRATKAGQREKERTAVKEYRRLTGHHKTYYAANKEKWVGYGKARSPEAVAAYSRRYRNKHHERVLARARELYHENPEHYRTKRRNYRARTLAAPGHHTVEQWIARVEYHGWRCFYCKCELTTDNLTMDHAIALNRGGTNWASNLVPACKCCNSGKRDKNYYEVISD